VLNQGFRSVAVVPVPVDGHVEGVLVIHGATPDRFDDREQTVLAELGDAIGYAIQNVDRVSALETEQRTEIELVISDDRLFSNQIAGAVGVDLTLVGAVAGDDETVRLFLRLADPPKTDIEEQLLDRSVVTGAQLLSSEGETALCLVTVERPQLIRSLEANGGKLRRLAVEDGTTKLTALLTGKTAVRAVVEELQDAYPETELLARRRSDEPIDTRETFRDQILAELTEKQLEALQTALYGGFYEWPRTSTRQELAATRDIASSTFSHHLRAAERKLVSAVLDSV
jgi:predicted DNA binding protein